jgi:hypothetical protein
MGHMGYMRSMGEAQMVGACQAATFLTMLHSFPRQNLVRNMRSMRSMGEAWVIRAAPGGALSHHTPQFSASLFRVEYEEYGGV